MCEVTTKNQLLMESFRRLDKLLQNSDSHITR